jgi:guanylate kinase
MRPLSSPDPTPKRGRLFVLSGPSGSGKSTLARRALARVGVPARLSISATTRPRRPGEVDGVDYRFLGREEFEHLRDRGEFLEWAEVHGNLYGTPAGPVEEALERGESVLLEIDVQGAQQVVRRMPEAVLIFVQAPTFDVLEQRLRARGSEDEATIQRRLANARRELEQARHYPFHLINDDLRRAVEELAALLSAPEQRTADPGSCTARNPTPLSP